MSEMFSGGGGSRSIPAEVGMNRFVWDMRYPGPENVPGAIMWMGSGRGPMAVPGRYEVRLTVGTSTKIRNWEWRMDPRVKVSQRDLQLQFDLLIQIREKLTEVNRSVIKLRSLKKQVTEVMEKVKGHDREERIKAEGQRLLKRMTEIENVLIQSKSKSGQDPLNYPILLDNKISALASVVGMSDARPTNQSNQVFRMLSSLADTQIGQLNLLLNRDIPDFNRSIRDANIPAVLIEIKK